MSIVRVCRGLPASGKSTYAKALLASDPYFKRVNRDSLRHMVDDGKWSKGNEKVIIDAELALAAQFLAKGFSVVVDDCNLAPSAMQRWEDFAKLYMATLEVEDFRHVSVEECIKRDQGRAAYVGEKVIRQMYRQFLAPKVTPLPMDPALPPAIICDLDGTLCLFGDANPYDRDFSRDALNEPVAHLVRLYDREGHAIILFSGRKEAARQQTEEWLARHGIAYALLAMRPQRDNRKDSILKEELYRAHVEGKFAVRFVIDDRNQVVALWRSLGLTCLQCADGDF